MTVKEFAVLEKSGAIFRLIDATKIGYMTTEMPIYEADRNAIIQMYGDAPIVGFRPQGKKVYLYIKPEQ